MKKKKMLCIICLVSTMLCCGCQKENTQSSRTTEHSVTKLEENTENKSDKANESDVIVDKTIKENNIISLTGKEDIVVINSTLDRAIPEDIQSVTKHATHIVQGVIQKVEYILLDGAAWTKTDVLVDQVLYGEMDNNTIISIYQLGGYCSADEYIKKNGDKGFENYSDKKKKNTMLKFVVEDEEMPKVGEESLYYLIQREAKYSGLPEGAYERVAGKYSQLQFLAEDSYEREQCENEEELEKKLGHQTKKKINKKEKTEQFQKKELKRVINLVKSQK